MLTAGLILISVGVILMIITQVCLRVKIKKIKTMWGESNEMR